MGEFLAAFDWQSILYNGVPLGVGVVLAAFWGKSQKVLNALKELSDVLSVITKALEDKKLTAEELEQIKVEGKEALAAFKAILK